MSTGRLDGKITVITGGGSGTGKASVKRFIDEGANVVDRYGRLDCHFNNAGVPMWATPVDEVSRDVWDTLISVDLTAAFLAAQRTDDLSRLPVTQLSIEAPGR